MLVMLLHAGKVCAGDLYKLKKGSVVFYSHSSQELIHAATEQLKGIMDITKKTYAFKIVIISFQGFNSELQREHFNENYMESATYPDATYTGKIIEDIDMSRDGDYDVRTKGKLKIHGIEQERIIKSHIVCKNGVIKIHSDFNVLLSDYNIKIPRVVNNKISNTINVTVDGIFVPGK
jgi:polyisoprenoid-binding protein YceI